MDELELLKVENEILKKTLCVAVEVLKREHALLERSVATLEKQDKVVDLLVDKLRRFGVNI